MDEGRLLRKYYEWRPQGRRPVGRPRVRWKDNIKAAVAERGSTFEKVENNYIRTEESGEILRGGVNGQGVY